MKYVTIGFNGKQVHITSDGKKVLCGAARSRNRGMIVAPQQLNLITNEQYDRVKSGNSKLTLCTACISKQGL